NGPGIPAEFQEHVFERFFRVKKGNQYKGQGFGIGLSYVKGVIEAHQGIIWLNVAYRDGCEFVIEL
ncbi:MAG TPA: ATP-binding protein, partial [Bacteroidetes bacterium]|nr:ATP-binding protein [Bacteroidota bacterium]